MENIRRNDLENFWKKVMLHQFHDTMSGSCIKEVYEDCEKDFKELKEFASKTIASRVNTSGEGEPLLVFNPLSWKRADKVQIKLSLSVPHEIEDFMGRKIPSQATEDGKKLIFIAETPALGYSLYRLKPAGFQKIHQTDIKVREEKGRILLENSKIRVSINKISGVIEELYEKDLKMNFIGDEGVRIQIFEDYPYSGRKTLFYDFDAVSSNAWEVYIYQQPGGVKYVELKDAEEVRVMENGPVRAIVLVKYKFKQVGMRLIGWLSSLFRSVSIAIIQHVKYPMDILNVGILCLRK